MKFKPTKLPIIPPTLVTSIFKESRDLKTFITLQLNTFILKLILWVGWLVYLVPIINSKRFGGHFGNQYIMSIYSTFDWHHELIRNFSVVDYEMKIFSILHKLQNYKIL